MIKNIIFDMGNVLIAFNPKEIIQRVHVDEKDAELLENTIFLSQEWVDLDSGSRTEDEICEKIKKKLPERLHDTMNRLITKWDEPLVEIEGMEKLVKEIKEKGYKIYLLSNASSRQKEYWDRISASKYFDGTLISADEKMMKPYPVIYHRLFEKFSIKPEESFFIDDSKDNIAAGERLGMPGVVFDGDAEELRKILIEKKIL